MERGRKEGREKRKIAREGSYNSNSPSTATIQLCHTATFYIFLLEVTKWTKRV